MLKYAIAIALTFEAATVTARADMTLGEYLKNPEAYAERMSQNQSQRGRIADPAPPAYSREQFIKDCIAQGPKDEPFKSQWAITCRKEAP